MTRTSLPRTKRIAFWFITLASTALIGLLALPVQAETSANYQSALGVNLQAVTYFSSEIPFLNVFKMGSGWMTQSASAWDTGEEKYLQLDANGYPTSLTTANDPNPQQF